MNEPAVVGFVAEPPETEPIIEDVPENSSFVSRALAAVQKIIDEESEEPNVVSHARQELELLGEDPDIINGYLTMLHIFGSMGHSGGSASVFIPTLMRLMEFKNLKPLTDDPAEWVHHTEETWGEPGGVWQNSRNGEAFSSDGGKTYTLLSDARVSNVPKRVHTSHDHTKSLEDFEDAPEPIEVNTDPVDGKYGRVFTERGSFEDNEPLFIFRARDEFILPVLTFYRDLCAGMGASGEHLEAIAKHKVQIAAWQLDHGTQLPD